MQIPIEIPRPKSSQTRLLLRCFGYLRPHWKLTLGAYTSMLAIDALNLLNPQILRWAIDNGILAEKFSLLGLASGALLALVVVKGVLSYFQGRWTEVASQNVAYDLRNALQRKITLLSFSFHDQAQAGDLLSRAIQDVERIRFLTGRATFRVVEGMVMMVTTAGVMVWMNPRLALVAVLSMPAAGAPVHPVWPVFSAALAPDPGATGGADHAGGAKPARRARGQNLRPGK